jgi:hypothetical protein
VLLSVTLVSFLSEFVFRSLLFSDFAFMQRFRNPSLYSDVESDEYWKLYNLFHVNGQDYNFHHKGAGYLELHPLLGWATDGSLLKGTYLHANSQDIGGRRPVLLYGDSFASCAALRRVECFQDILNNDKEFAQNYYLLNFGCGGYGVDQISLLFMNSIHLYRHPFVVLSLMTHDLDRSLTSVRDGNMKPYFELVGDELVLRREHIKQDRRTFFTQNRPVMISYLYRLWLYSDAPLYQLRKYLRNSDETRRHSIEINKNIILSAIKELRKNQIAYVFVVFAPIESVLSDDWKSTFLEELLKDNGVPYLLTKEIIKKDALQNHKDVHEYFLPSPDNHPNEYQNGLIAREIKRFIFERSRISANHSNPLEKSAL